MPGVASAEPAAGVATDPPPLDVAEQSRRTVDTRSMR